MGRREAIQCAIAVPTCLARLPKEIHRIRLSCKLAGDVHAFKKQHSKEES